MAGYIGSKSSVTQVDGYSEAEADAEFVNDPNGAITVSGSNVGIGASSPERALHVNSGTGNNVAVFQSTDADARVEIRDSGSSQGYNTISVTANEMYFGTNNSERMRIDSSGNVGIGSPPAYNLHIEKAGNQFIFLNNASTNDGFYFKAGTGASSIQTNGGSNVMNFFTSGNERMRIDSSGNLLVGTTSVPTGTGVGIGLQADAGGAFLARRTLTTNTNSAALFYNPNGLVGSIQTSGSSTSYNTSSDYRLKENVVDLTGASARVNQLNPSRFNFIADADTTIDGFLAHEVADVVPEAISGTKDAMMDEEYEVTPAVEATYDEDGNELTAAVEAVMGTRSVPDYQGIDQSKLVPLLTAALQEALTEIASLKTRVQALEDV